MPDPIGRPAYATPEFLAWLRTIVHAAVWRCSETVNTQTNPNTSEKVQP